MLEGPEGYHQCRQAAEINQLCCGLTEHNPYYILYSTGFYNWFSTGVSAEFTALHTFIISVDFVS